MPAADVKRGGAAARLGQNMIISPCSSHAALEPRWNPRWDTDEARAGRLAGYSTYIRNNKDLLATVTSSDSLPATHQHSPGSTNTAFSRDITRRNTPDPRANTMAPKILIILTSTRTLRGTDKKTGWYLVRPETHPHPSPAHRLPHPDV